MPAPCRSNGATIARPIAGGNAPQPRVHADDGGEFPGGREIFPSGRTGATGWPVFPRPDKGLRGGAARFPRAGTGSFSSASREFPNVSREIVKPPYLPLAAAVLFR